MQQTDLFAIATKYPEGFHYKPDFISLAEEKHLAERLQQLEF